MANVAPTEAFPQPPEVVLYPEPGGNLHGVRPINREKTIADAEEVYKDYQDDDLSIASSAEVPEELLKASPTVGGRKDVRPEHV